MECFGSLVIENINVAEFMETKYPYSPIRAARFVAMTTVVTCRYYQSQISADLLSINADMLSVKYRSALNKVQICSQ